MEGHDEVEFSIVMPCLNEAETLGTCIEKAQEGIRRASIAAEVIVGDNGSTDGSQERSLAGAASVWWTSPSAVTARRCMVRPSLRAAGTSSWSGPWLYLLWSAGVFCATFVAALAVMSIEPAAARAPTHPLWVGTLKYAAPPFAAFCMYLAVYFPR